MNFLDILVIYLACGSPFGVYYFFNDRPRNGKRLVKSVFIVAIWIPFSIQLLHTKVTDKLQDRFEQKRAIKIDNLKKHFEYFLQETRGTITLFELRDLLERYSELSLINSEMLSDPAKHEKEIFRVTGKKDFDLSAICLNRRNRKRLSFHQSLAREDFLKILRELLEVNSETKKLRELSTEFVKIINDEKASAYLVALFVNSPQTVENSPVKYLEQDLWIPTEQKPSSEIETSTTLQTMSAKTNSPKQD